MTTTLSALLTPEQCRQVEELIAQHASDSLALVKALKHYFEPIANDLEAKGVLPEYLAYTIAANLQISIEQMSARN